MNTQQAIKEYLAGIDDPTGPVYKAAYKSFSRGQTEKYAYAMRIGMEYDIDPRKLLDAELVQMAEILCRPNSR
jgi:hypothetical protein